MKKTTIILAVAAILLAVLTAIVWLMPAESDNSSHSYGCYEGLQLVKEGNGNLVVKDEKGNMLFPIPLRGCDVDTRYRGGRLRFSEKATGRKGYIDRFGIVNFYDDKAPQPEGSNTNLAGGPRSSSDSRMPSPSRETISPREANPSIESKLPTTDLRTMARNNPFYQEAAKILQGKLDEKDAGHRHVILNYCEHLRTAYTTKDIDFLRQVFSDDALIIVGNVVREKAGGENMAGADRRVTYALHTKRDYLNRLAKVFSMNKRIDVRFSDFHIMRHPTRDGIYGVTLRQHYKSDRYEDDGWLFLLWDFRNPSMPVIHVRTWQPARTVGSEDDVINISDFNLE